MGAFATAVIGISGHDATTWVGSGTLVVIKGAPGVLTACHVWDDAVEGFARLAFPDRTSFNAPGIPPRDLRAIRIRSDDPTDEFGADLAFIQLPTDLATAMWNSGSRPFDLTDARRHATKVHPTAAGELRLVFGTPTEATSDFRDEDWTGPITCMHIYTHTLASRVVKTYEHDAYDYADFSLENKQNDDFPTDYSGMSGSGMWWVGYQEGGRLHADLESIFLDGVVLRYGRKGEQHPEFLRCHGRQSIYRLHDDVVSELGL